MCCRSVEYVPLFICVIGVLCIYISVSFSPALIIFINHNCVIIPYFHIKKVSLGGRLHDRVTSSHQCLPLIQKKVSVSSLWHLRTF